MENSNDHVHFATAAHSIASSSHNKKWSQLSSLHNATTNGGRWYGSHQSSTASASNHSEKFIMRTCDIQLAHLMCVETIFKFQIQTEARWKETYKPGVVKSWPTTCSTTRRWSYAPSQAQECMRITFKNSTNFKNSGWFQIRNTYQTGTLACTGVAPHSKADGAKARQCVPPVLRTAIGTPLVRIATGSLDTCHIASTCTEQILLLN